MLPSDFFSGLKVVELAGVLAGPATGMFFAELGAEVLKIENKKSGGDVTRQWKLPIEDAQAPLSAYYCSVNWGKKTIFLDYADSDDYIYLQQILKEADIVLVNFKKGDDQRWKLDYDEVKKINPHIIYGKITGFGDTDSRAAFDVVLQAESGFMSMNGTPESGPLKMPVALIDILCAHQLKEGLLLALLHKYKTGKGSLVSVSLFDSALASLANQASNCLMSNYTPGLNGSLHPNIAPYGETFITQDKRYLVLAVGSDKQFITLCSLLNLPALASDEKFRLNAARVKYRASLYTHLSAIIATLQAEELLNLLNEHHVPAAIVRSLDEVMQAPQVEKLLLREQKDGLQTTTIRGNVFHIAFA